jgi:hypothetical protein
LDALGDPAGRMARANFLRSRRKEGKVTLSNETFAKVRWYLPIRYDVRWVKKTLLERVCATAKRMASDFKVL